MLFNNPLGSAKADRLVELLPLAAGGRVLDAGCGGGEFLLRVVDKHAVEGVGVDRDPRCIQTARERAESRGLANRCAFHEAEMGAFTAPPGSFEAAICLGSTHAFGAGEAAYPNTLARMRELVRPGGHLLVGEGFWRREPAAEYLALLGDPVGVYRDHAENIAKERGWQAVYAAVSSDDEWDDFEWSHQMRLQREAAADPANPANPAWPARLARARAWREGYLRWGRSTLGFGFYLFRKAEDGVGPEA